ncbi:hypothetical protein IE81DRAFT_327276 [Ceraceosorus guamensis]|uniref:Uncharacterized protein n=1 Tax=Ceraceosorus guamensis TaxID=1522189 RepID=A0A316VM82_9BASI|nr:hypothetical protein IE81DRAFT_327276 [Ceraceosorus guamensis]PWN38647.1 hypothetical protein IE81DRAFT_327276 [Ceraceosorus guamensis]
MVPNFYAFCPGPGSKTKRGRERRARERERERAREKRAIFVRSSAVRSSPSSGLSLIMRCARIRNSEGKPDREPGASGQAPSQRPRLLQRNQQSIAHTHLSKAKYPSLSFERIRRGKEKATKERGSWLAGVRVRYLVMRALARASSNLRTRPPWSHPTQTGHLVSSRSARPITQPTQQAARARRGRERGGP